MTPPAVVFGKIADATGAAQEGVIVGVEAKDSRIADAVTDDEGGYRTAVYPSGEEYDLSATRGRKGGWNLGLRLTPGEWRRADFSLKEAAVISGRVRTMDTNFFQPAVVVQAIRAAPPQSNETARVVATLWTDPNGQFEFVNLKQGSYRLRAHGPGTLIDYEDGKPIELESGQSRLNLNFRMPPVKKGLWKNYTLMDGLRNDDVHDLLFDRQGMLWVATRGVVLRFDGLQWAHYTKEDGLSDNRVNGLAQDAKGNLWFATEQGVTCLANGAWRRFTLSERLPDNQVRAVAIAPGGSIWAATAQGVSRFDGADWKKFDWRDGLADENVYSLLIEPAGEVWFGTSGGASRFDGEGFQNFSAKDGLAPHGVFAIHRDPDGVLWFAGNGRVTRYDGRSFVQITAKEGLLPGVVQSLYRDPQGILWFGVNGRSGSSEGGVARWDGESFVFLTKGDGLAGSGVRSIRQTPDGALWFATDGGVSRYDEGTFRNFTVEDGLPHNTVSRLHAFPDGTLWFWRMARGTDEYHWPETDAGEGISRFDGRTFRTFTVADGLAGNHVQAICREPDGEVWITGQGGVSRFDGARFREAITGGEWGRDGGISICRDTEGTIWIGRHNGVSVSRVVRVENFSMQNELANQHVSAVHRDAGGAALVRHAESRNLALRRPAVREFLHHQRFAQRADLLH